MSSDSEPAKEVYTIFDRDGHAVETVHSEGAAWAHLCGAGSYFAKVSLPEPEPIPARLDFTVREENALDIALRDAWANDADLQK